MSSFLVIFLEIQTNRVKIMIRIYGQFWNSDMVDWGGQGRGRKGSLMGTGKPKYKSVTDSVEIDCWKQRGIYVLHNNYKTVYVGRARGGSSCIGDRLRHHLSDHLEGRWDAFSWYGIDSVRADGTLREVFKTRPMEAGDIVKAYEAIAIIIADPPLNRRQESLKGAIEIEQIEKKNFRTNRQLLEEIWASLKPEGNNLG